MSSAKKSKLISLEISLFDADSLTAQIRVTNESDSMVLIGDMNHANIKIRSPQHFDASPWISTHIPNSGRVRQLTAGDEVFYEIDLLTDFSFPKPAEYDIWAIYNSSGFPERFADSDDFPQFAGLAKLDEIKTISNSIRVEISAERLEQNRKSLRRLG